MSSTLKKLVGALLGTKLRNETAPDSTLTSTHVTDVTATVPMTTATATIPIDESEYTKYMLSSLWDGMVIATAKVSTTAIPTPISKAELIEPPNMPEFHSELRLPEDFIWGWAATAPQSEGAVEMLITGGLQSGIRLAM
jgi:hypothetical protein